MTTTRETFFRNLDQLIKADGCTKSSLAAELGIRQSTVSNWYARKTVPIDYLDKIAGIFDVSVPDLFDKNVSFKRSVVVIRPGAL